MRQSHPLRQLMQGDHSKLELERKRLLRNASRIVVKVGTSTVTAPDGTLRRDYVEPLVSSIARLHAAGKQVVLVSSGAIGLGRGWVGLHRSRLDDLVTKQACAAVGQGLLMNAYKEMFSAWHIKIAQVLLTSEDFSNWRRYTNLRRTMEKLLTLKVLPVVNENDTVSTAEIESLGEGGRRAAFSDNDRLAALVMSGLDMDALILLTNVDGLLRTQPTNLGRSEDSDAIPLIAKITPELKALAAGPAAGGRGGMLTKLEAGEIAMNCGRIAVIANGARPDILDRILAGERIVWLGGKPCRCVRQRESGLECPASPRSQCPRFARNSSRSLPPQASSASLRVRQLQDPQRAL